MDILSKNKESNYIKILIKIETETEKNTNI